jgi:hypothetical protein
MIIKHVLNKTLPLSIKQDYRGESKYAAIDKEEHKFFILDRPFEAGPAYICLKDVSYLIKEGVLYIQGTQLFYLYRSQFLERLDLWGLREIYIVRSEHNYNLLEDPPKLSEIVIHRWWRNNKKFQGIEFMNERVLSWYKLKREEPFEYAMSSFILEE